MKLIEVKQYSTNMYIPESKRSLNIKEQEKYYERVYYGQGLIDIDSILTIRPIGTYDKETLKYDANIYCIYFKDSDITIYIDKDDYAKIKKINKIYK